MRFICNNNVNDPHINLALEEFCLRNPDMTDDYVLFYINAPSVIIGKHQNPFEECNLAYLRQTGIQLVRRISGGGAVYHDHGNLNFSFITGFKKEKLDYIQKLIQPILRALHRLGIPAELAEKNYIMVDGKKASGNSQYTNIHRMLSHGTLLFDSELKVLETALRSDLEIKDSKAVKSARSEVMNISDYTSQPDNISDMRDQLAEAVSAQFGELNKYVLSDRDWDAIYSLAEDKYKSWDWTFGRTPDFTVRQAIQYEGDLMDCKIQVRRGLIHAISICDKSREGVMNAELKSRFIGQRYNEVQFQIQVASRSEMGE